MLALLDRLRKSLNIRSLNYMPIRNVGASCFSSGIYIFGTQEILSLSLLILLIIVDSYANLLNRNLSIWIQTLYVSTLIITCLTIILGLYASIKWRTKTLRLVSFSRKKGLLILQKLIQFILISSSYHVCNLI